MTRSAISIYVLFLVFLLCVPIARGADQGVQVLYAGSLGAVMENGLGPAFAKATGRQYQGEAQGSLGGAQMIRSHIRTPDVFVSSDPSVNDQILMGSKNGYLVKWYVTFASSQLVIGYNPHSKFAEKFQQAANGQVPWYQVLETSGLRFGRGDPSIDPKGYRTLMTFNLAAKYYHRPELASLTGDPMNPAQVFPEIVLMARVESGQFDAGIFYKHEAVAHKLPFITLPAQINLGDQHFADLYSTATYTNPSGEVLHGSPILFTVTIPENAPHREAAVAFALFLLNSENLLSDFGFGKVERRVVPSANALPAELKAVATASSCDSVPRSLITKLPPVLCELEFAPAATDLISKAQAEAASANRCYHAEPFLAPLD